MDTPAPKKLPRRADTSAKKDQALAELRAAWEKSPKLRLGQLLVCALAEAGIHESQIFNVEDLDLTNALLHFRA